MYQKSMNTREVGNIQKVTLSQNGSLNGEVGKAKFCAVKKIHCSKFGPLDCY